MRSTTLATWIARSSSSAFGCSSRLCIRQCRFKSKERLSNEGEANQIRDAYEPAERIGLYMKFAEDRLKKFQYELNRKVQDRRRAEVLNNLLNAYTGCMDDAADQIEVGKERQADIHGALKLMKSKGNEFLDILEKIQEKGQELDTYKDTLLDALDGTKEALTDVDNALKTAAPPPVRRKQS